MKFIFKHVKLIVFVVTIILIYIIYTETVDKNNITYINLGDCYAMGVNSYNERSYGYGDYLKDYLSKNNRLKVYYDNFNYKDMMIKDLKKDIIIGKSNGMNLKQALRESELLTLSIGINDLIYQKSINNYNDKQIIDNIMEEFDNLIMEIKKYYKYDIYIIGYYNVFKTETYKDILNQLNSKYEKYSKDNNLVFVKIDSNLDDYYKNPNSIYPNYLGYKEIYKEIIRKSKFKKIINISKRDYY